VTAAASPTTVVAYGEVLLRLKSPGDERLLQGRVLEASVGGAELNVLASLSQFGRATRLATTLPDHSLGDAALAEIRALGIDTGAVNRRPGRLGIYFLERGQGARAGQVIYDRAGSAFAMDTSERSWPDLLSGASCLHLTGITPALSSDAAAGCLEAARAARRLGITVSLDINHRAQLWAATGNSAGAALAPLCAETTWLFANGRDMQMILEEDGSFEQLSASMLQRAPQLKLVCTCSRTGHHADRIVLGATGRTRTAFCATTERQIYSVVDRVGAGDAFAAGVLHGLLGAEPLQDALEFGLAAAVLKHTVPGDINRVSKAEVLASVKGVPASLLRR
jgi:2-dehydro-3-deoxygluconokinase